MQWSVSYGPEDIFYNREKKHMWVNTSWEAFIASDQINIYRIGSILDLHAWSQTPTLILQNSITPSMSLFWIVCFWTAFHLNGVEDFDFLGSKPKANLFIHSSGLLSIEIYLSPFQTIWILPSRSLKYRGFPGLVNLWIIVRTKNRKTFKVRHHLPEHLQQSGYNEHPFHHSQPDTPCKSWLLWG